MEIGGLPLHPLVVHLVVPRWRWLLRWPAALTAVGAVAAAWVARLSGGALLEDRPFLLEAEPLRTQIVTHQRYGELLSWVVIPFALVVLVAAWALPGAASLSGGGGGRESRVPGRDTALLVGVVVLATAVLVLVVLTGDSGSRAVWG